MKNFKAILEGADIQLDTDITTAETKPVGSQDPTLAAQGNVNTMPGGEGNEKTPDSVETNLETPVGGATQMEVNPIAKGPQDAPTKAMPDVVNMPKAEEQPHEVLESKKSLKVYTILEDTKINGIVYKKGTKISLLEGEEIPSVLSKEDQGDMNKIADMHNAEAPKANEPGVADAVKVQMAEDEIANATTMTDPVNPEFVIVDGKPCAIVNDLGEEMEVLYDATTGETKTVGKDQVQEYIFNESKFKKGSNKSMNKKVYTVKESVTINQGNKDIILEEGDKFVIMEDDKEEGMDDTKEYIEKNPWLVISKDKQNLGHYPSKEEAEKEAKEIDGATVIKESFKIKEEPKADDSEQKKENIMPEAKKVKEADEVCKDCGKDKEDCTCKKEPEVKMESFITLKGKKYRVVEAEGDAKDSAEDAELAKKAGMSPEEWEKSEKDKVHDKKEESKKMKEAKELSFSSSNEAEQYLKKNGYSIGRMQGYDPRGIKKGVWDIQKWRNLSSDDIDFLDGTLEQEGNQVKVILKESKKMKEDKVHDKKEEDAPKDKNGKFPFEAGYIKPEDDKKEDKKTESVASFKKRKVYTVKECVMIGDVLLEAGDKFVVLSEEDTQKPDPDDKMDLVDQKLNMVAVADKVKK